MYDSRRNTQIGTSLCSVVKVDAFQAISFMEHGGKKKRCRMCRRVIWRFPNERTKICAMCEVQSLPEALYKAKQRSQHEDWHGIYD